MAAPGFQHWHPLAHPTVVINRFRAKHPDISGDRYLYLPGTSFKLPGDMTLENVDLTEDRFPCPDDVIEAATYVFEGPAFLAWPAGQTQIHGDNDHWIDLVRYVSRKPPAYPVSGRWVVPERSTPNPAVPDLPGFGSFVAAPGEIPGVEPIYGHRAQTSDGATKYMYDAVELAHDGWGPGTSEFSAVPLGALAAARDAAEKAANATANPPTPENLTSETARKKISAATKGLLGPDRQVNQQTLANLLEVLTGEGLPVKAFTVGVSADAGVFVSGTCETGAVFDLQHNPIGDYVTLAGGVALSAGFSFNLTIGAWWGPTQDGVLEAMQGLSLYFMAGAVAFGGVNLFVVCTEDMLPYGLIISPQAGLEVEIGGGWGASYTWF